MERFLRLALGYFVLATGLGLVLRYAVVAPVTGLTFGNALHAHSHTLYFGWAALSLFTLFFDRVQATDGAVRRAQGGIVLVSAATFVAFLHSGYHLPGIVVSASSLAVWGVSVALFLNRSRALVSLDLAYLRVGVVYVVVAGLAALARVVVLVAKVPDPMWGQLAVHGFLQAFAGFFLFGVVGLLAHFLEARGAPLDRRLLRWQLGWMTPLTALTFPLGVPASMDTPLGALARVASVLLLVPAALWLVNLWTAARHVPGPTRAVLRSIALAWVLMSLFQVVAAFGLASVGAASRHAVILQLHLVLLGVVSTSLLLLVQARLGHTGSLGLLAHQLGVATLSAGLALAAFAAVLPPAWGVAGLWLAFAGGALVFAADLTVVVTALRRPA